jgi:hypothetical protein
VAEAIRYVQVHAGRIASRKRLMVPPGDAGFGAICQSLCHTRERLRPLAFLAACDFLLPAFAALLRASLFLLLWSFAVPFAQARRTGRAPRRARLRFTCSDGNRGDLPVGDRYLVDANGDPIE